MYTPGLIIVTCLEPANHGLENLFCAGTYEKILAVVAESAVSGASVKFLTKVTHIETVDDRARVLGDAEFDSEYDEVVVTAPLGWLKRNKIAFHPPLPERLCQAIDAIGYGSLEKVSDSRLQQVPKPNCLRCISLSLGHSGSMMFRQKNNSQASRNTWRQHMLLAPIRNVGTKKA